MAKLTIEIDMDDPQSAWDALYRRIEQIAEEPASAEATTPPNQPATYDLLLDPERAFREGLGDAGDFLNALRGQD